MREARVKFKEIFFYECCDDATKGTKMSSEGSEYNAIQDLRLNFHK